MNAIIQSDSEDEESIPRIFRDRSCPFETLPDPEFRRTFRFSRPVFYELCGMLKSDLQHISIRSSALTVAQQVAACLNLLGRNAMQEDIARLTGCSQPTVSRAVRTFLDAVVKRAPHFIYWPSSNEQKRIAQRVYSKYRLPNIVGMIDGTHMRISAPSGNAVDYVNRKRYHSINIGAICDDNYKFRWISASWPGSAQDSRVFNCTLTYSHGVRLVA